MTRRLGWLGPAIVFVGAAVAGVGIWYFLHARPRPGAVIATYAVDPHTSLVVRGEDGGDRAFIELRSGDDVQWQALVPHYAGTAERPAIAWSQNAVSIRVEREGRAEVFAIAMHDSAKLGGFRLAPEHEPITTQPTGPITLTDHVRSYEIAGGTNWHEMVAIDLQSGKALWKIDLGSDPIQAGGLRGGLIWLVQRNLEREFNVFTGREDKTKQTSNPL
jgi:hypothetical protein